MLTIIMVNKDLHKIAREQCIAYACNVTFNDFVRMNVSSVKQINAHGSLLFLIFRLKRQTI